MENDLNKLTIEQALRNRLLPMALDDDFEKTKKRIQELVKFILDGE
jgi:hypothetical protein